MTHPNILAAAQRGRERRTRESLDRYYANPSICKYCKKIIELNGRRVADIREKKFCDSSCAAKYNNKMRGMRNGRIQDCLICNAPLHKGAKKYCSRKCSRVAIKESRIKRTIEKMESGSPVHQSAVRKTILDIREYKCEICGLTDWLGKSITLFVDHINGNPYDNTLKNLRLICPNCDSQTDTFMGKNRGNGRWKRRERYNSGKSS